MCLDAFDLLALQTLEALDGELGLLQQRPLLRQVVVDRTLELLDLSLVQSALTVKLI